MNIEKPSVLERERAKEKSKEFERAMPVEDTRFLERAILLERPKK